MDYPLSMYWRDVVFLNFRCNPAIVQKHLPKSMRVELFEGQAVLTIAFLKMQDLEIRYIPKILSQDFVECNLRTYVSCIDKKGVFFFSLDTDVLLEVLGANLLFSLNYRYRKVDITIEDQIYTFFEKSWFSRKKGTFFQGTILKTVKHLAAIDVFISERTSYFVEKRGILFEGKVDHPDWEFYPLEPKNFHTDLLDRFERAEIESALYAKGFEVKANTIRPAFNPIIFFDASCGLCSLFVRFLIFADRNEYFKFAPIEGKTFYELDKKDQRTNQIILSEKIRVSHGSLALLRGLSYLPWYLRFLKILEIFPQRWLDRAYKFVALRRKICPLKVQKISEKRLLP